MIEYKTKYTHMLKSLKSSISGKKRFGWNPDEKPEFIMGDIIEVKLEEVITERYKRLLYYWIITDKWVKKVLVHELNIKETKALALWVAYQIIKGRNQDKGKVMNQKEIDELYYSEPLERIEIGYYYDMAEGYDKRDGMSIMYKDGNIIFSDYHSFESKDPVTKEIIEGEPWFNYEYMERYLVYSHEVGIHTINANLMNGLNYGIYGRPKNKNRVKKKFYPMEDAWVEIAKYRCCITNKKMITIVCHDFQSKKTVDDEVICTDATDLYEALKILRYKDKRDQK